MNDRASLSQTHHAEADFLKRAGIAHRHQLCHGAVGADGRADIVRATAAVDLHDEGVVVGVVYACPQTIALALLEECNPDASNVVAVGLRSVWTFQLIL